MKLNLKYVIPVIITGIIALSIQACTGTDSVRLDSDSTGEDSSSLFDTTELSVNPVEVYAGVEVVITARITNTSNSTQTYTAGLRLDDETVATKELTFAPGETQPVSFIGSVSAPGKYTVTWTELVGSFLVPRLTEELLVVEDDATEPGEYRIPAPDFTAKDVVTGESITLFQYAGSKILLNFVNYGCDPTTNKVVGKQLLAIRELKEQDTDFIPISVFCGCCPEDVLRDFAKKNDLTWPWILDSDNSIVRIYGDYLRKNGYPTLIFIDDSQNIHEVTGYTNVSDLEEKINRMETQLQDI